ncbi:MAG: clostripain-related cysteine peptidase [Rikenellaceae bacterium]
MRRYLYIIMAMALLFVSCSDKDGEFYEEGGSGEEQQQQTDTDDSDEQVNDHDDDIVEQTTIMYFMGTSLKSNYFDRYNIPDTQSAVASGALGSNGRLLIFMPNISNATLYEIYQTSGGYATETIATFEDGYNYKSFSTTPANLVDVIEKSQEYAPAKRYNLILSGHGTGWVLQSHPRLRSIDTELFSWEKRDNVDVETRFFGGSIDGYMEVTEFREALEQISTKFGYILFDMCFMSNIETIYELKDLCDNVVASPCEVMGYGYPYQTILPQLFTDDGKNYDLEGACLAFYEFYDNLSNYPSGAVALCQTANLERLASVLKRINESGVNSVDINDLQCYENLASNVFCDLWHYVNEACVDSSLLSEFNSAMDLAFPVKYHTDQFYTGLSYSDSVWESGRTYWVDIDDTTFSGVSTTEPSTKFTDEWVETSWAVATMAN